MTVSASAALAAVLSFAAAMACAGIIDLLTMKIRNALVIFLLVTYLALAPLAGLELATIVWSAATGLLVLLCTFGLFKLGWIGGGDAKLAAVTALWLGAQHTPQYIAYTALLGGVLALVLLGLRAVPLPSRWKVVPWVARLRQPQIGIPYAVAMAPAALLVLPHTPWTAAL